MIQAGDFVRVHPHGTPNKNAIGKVLTCSANQRSIIVAFEDSPPFIVILGGGMAIGPDGLHMIAAREGPVGANGEIVGPWSELFGGGHYEIETAEIRDGGRAIHCFRCRHTSTSGRDVKELFCPYCERHHEFTAAAVQAGGQDKTE